MDANKKIEARIKTQLKIAMDALSEADSIENESREPVMSPNDMRRLQQAIDILDSMAIDFNGTGPQGAREELGR